MCASAQQRPCGGVAHPHTRTKQRGSGRSVESLCCRGGVDQVMVCACCLARERSELAEGSLSSSPHLARAPEQQKGESPANVPLPLAAPQKNPPISAASPGLTIQAPAASPPAHLLLPALPTSCASLRAAVNISAARALHALRLSHTHHTLPSPRMTSLIKP